MILLDLLRVVESNTTISLYLSKDDTWSTNEEMIITTGCRSLMDYQMYYFFKVIGVKVDKHNILHVCVTRVKLYDIEGE